MADGRGKWDRTGREIKRADCDVHLEKGEASHFLHHNLALMKLPSIDIKNPDEVGERCALFFEMCDADDVKPNLPALALALGIDRPRLWEVSNGLKFQGDKTGEVSAVLKKAILLMEAQMNDYMQNGKINPVSAIFLSKNHFNYADKQQVEVAAQSPLGNDMSTDDIERKYIGDTIVGSPDDIKPTKGTKAKKSKNRTKGHKG